MMSVPLRLCLQYGPGGAARNPLAAILVALLALAWPAPQARAEAPVQVVALGDSLAAGYGLPQGEGLVPQLQAWLEAQGAGPVEVVNMGVSGDTSAGGRARLDWALGESADAVILELGANDMLRGVDPAETRANLAAILEALDARGLPVLIVGMRAMANFGANYKARFDAIYPELAKRHGAALYPFFFDGLFDRDGLMQADGLHPNAEGVALVVERIGPMVLDLVREARK